MKAYASFRHGSRFGSLDGLRCLAILPVVWHHSTARPLEGLLGKGPLGVHLFFAISGFLITTLLLRERERDGELALGRFHARRALRIFPLYYLVLVLYAAHAWLFRADSPLTEHFLRSLPYYASYTGNWFVDYSAPHPVVFGFSWSLATEAQFYLFWPVVVALLPGLARPAAVMFGLFALDFATESGWLSAFVAESSIAHAMITSLSAPICLGSLLALALHHEPTFARLSTLLGARVAAPLSLALLLGAVAADAPLVAIHVAMVLLVAAVTFREDHALARALGARLPRFVGEVSYGIYLLHVSVITAAKWLLPGAGAPVVFAAATLGSVGLAALSHRWFEGPMMRSSARLRGRSSETELTGSATPAS